jgi:uncharacterized membrane protein
MRETLFFAIGILLLIIASFYDLQLFVDILGPAYEFIKGIGINTEILYIGGSLALVIGMFSGLPTWLSVLIFLALVFGGSYYLSDENISIKVNDITIM